MTETNAHILHATEGRVRKRRARERKQYLFAFGSVIELPVGIYHNEIVPISFSVMTNE
jgi:hypothetical protein